MSRITFRSGIPLLTLVLVLPSLALVGPAAQPAPSGIGSGPITYTHYTSPFGGSAGETSIGVNPHTNNAFFIRLTKVDRIHWDDSVSPPLPTWSDVTPPTVATFDPILWTDRAAGKTYVVQLLIAASQMSATQSLLTPDGAVVVNDGDVWLDTMPATSAPFFDHQTVGGGPHAVAVAAGVETGDPNVLANGIVANGDQVTGQADAVYYCGQLGVTVCGRSDDDGVTWSPYVPINAQDTCQGLVGHVVVDHQGTVYVPDAHCGANGQAAHVSTTNGVAWVTHYMPGSAGGRSDPAMAVDDADKVYFAMTSRGRPMVSMTIDHGTTWSEPIDVAPQFPGIANVEFSMMVAGSPGRAAMAFYGTDTPGSDQGAGFAGRWHLYVSTTFDGGATWEAIDTTPDVRSDSPVQVGCIWLGGGNNACRNLLDFQGATLDAQGRVLVGYADGCVPTRCGPNGGSSLGTIARQTSGRTLYAQYDV
ncbi:MAG: glycoside hydrolase [Halobacteriales archaeon]|nr:glycoside hydrolase [Halobacteriales archaeon]